MAIQTNPEPQPQTGIPDRLREFLELHAWPAVPPEARRKWSRYEEESMPGYGEHGEPV